MDTTTSIESSPASTEDTIQLDTSIEQTSSPIRPQSQQFMQNHDLQFDNLNRPPSVNDNKSKYIPNTVLPWSNSNTYYDYQYPPPPPAVFYQYQNSDNSYELNRPALCLTNNDNSLNSPEMYSFQTESTTFLYSSQNGNYSTEMIVHDQGGSRNSSSQNNVQTNPCQDKNVVLINGGFPILRSSIRDPEMNYPNLQISEIHQPISTTTTGPPATAMSDFQSGVNQNLTYTPDYRMETPPLPANQPLRQPKPSFNDSYSQSINISNRIVKKSSITKLNNSLKKNLSIANTPIKSTTPISSSNSPINRFLPPRRSFSNTSASSCDSPPIVLKPPPRTMIKNLTVKKKPSLRKLNSKQSNQNLYEKRIALNLNERVPGKSTNQPEQGELRSQLISQSSQMSNNVDPNTSLGEIDERNSLPTLNINETPSMRKVSTSSIDTFDTTISEDEMIQDKTYEDFVILNSEDSEIIPIRGRPKTTSPKVIPSKPSKPKIEKVDENGNVTKHKRKRTLPRSKHGCWICRIKHLKCDESKPECNNCSRYGLNCEYSLEKPDYVINEVFRAEKMAEISRLRKEFQSRAKKRSENKIK
ncbi:unnamed protein product [Candida verbasci]|uniref:Zn(2)-C6 fungal-type domain-containing protein n=1 Tax=Candida verbasci TaxID=1227364 RepID=A0A9W4TV70_9ASCO|nr:unnamed protein product [Candida verbasci]